ncbi:MAG TPA: hypothetical protein DIC36_02460 [Gammaproteobacteria bacterium]|nr:hypothetical protein [Gammaproteobacteria bacterium]
MILTFPRSRRRASQSRPGAVASRCRARAASFSGRRVRRAPGRGEKRRKQGGSGACFLSVTFLCTSKER